MIGFDVEAEQAELIYLVRDLVQAKITPFSLEMDLKGDDDFDWSFVKLLAEHNLLAPIVPRKYGGRNLNYVTMALLIEEIATGCAGLAGCMIGILHAISPIIIGGTEKQKNDYLPIMVTPEPVLAAFALTEPTGGSDLQAIYTNAKHEKGTYVLNGVKDYVVNGSIAKFVNVCCSTRMEYSRYGLRFFIVPDNQINVKHIINTLGIKYAKASQLVFDNTRIPEDNAIGSEGSGYLLLTQTLDIGRAMVGAMLVGIARAAYNLALKYSRERHQFKKPIFSYQGVSFPLVEMATSIDAARLMVWKACYLIDQGKDCTKASSMAKIFASQVAQEVTSKAIDIMGAKGYTTDNLLNVYYRDAKLGSILEGTTNIQKMIIASLL